MRLKASYGTFDDWPTVSLGEAADFNPPAKIQKGEMVSVVEMTALQTELDGHSKGAATLTRHIKANLKKLGVKG